MFALSRRCRRRRLRLRGGDGYRKVTIWRENFLDFFVVDKNGQKFNCDEFLHEFIFMVFWRMWVAPATCVRAIFYSNLFC